MVPYASQERADSAMALYPSPLPAYAIRLHAAESACHVQICHADLGRLALRQASEGGASDDEIPALPALRDFAKREGRSLEEVIGAVETFLGKRPPQPFSMRGLRTATSAAETGSDR